MIRREKGLKLLDFEKKTPFEHLWFKNVFVLKNHRF